MLVDDACRRRVAYRRHGAAANEPGDWQAKHVHKRCTSVLLLLVLELWASSGTDSEGKGTARAIRLAVFQGGGIFQSACLQTTDRVISGGNRPSLLRRWSSAKVM